MAADSIARRDEARRTPESQLASRLRTCNQMNCICIGIQMTSDFRFFFDIFEMDQIVRQRGLSMEFGSLLGGFNILRVFCSIFSQFMVQT